MFKQVTYILHDKKILFKNHQVESINLRTDEKNNNNINLTVSLSFKLKKHCLQPII